MFRLVVFAAVAVLTAVTAYACGGDDDKTIDLGDGNEVTTSDELPDDFPDDFPIYDGADLQGSLRGETAGIEGFIVTWQTGDDIEDVRAFYDDELADGPWTETSSGDLGDQSAFWSAENDDGSKSAYVNVTDVDGETQILVTIGDQDDEHFGGGDGDDANDDNGSDDGDSDDDVDDDDTDAPDAELPDEVELSDDFPQDRVPLPDDARVTNSSSFTTGGLTTHAVELYSEDSVDDLIEFFTTELEGNGWTESLSSESNGEAFLSFSPDNGADATAESVLITISPSEVEGYADVSVIVSASD